MPKHKFLERGDLLRKLLSQAIAWKGSIESVAKIMGVHVHTVSRILAVVEGKYQSNGSKETVHAFQAGFNITEEEYQLGPEQYKKPGVEETFRSDHISLAYQLSKLQENLNEIPTPLFVMSFQHLDNWKDFFIIIVDLYNRGLEHGVQAVIHKKKPPKTGNTVLVWKHKPQGKNSYAEFIKWDEENHPQNITVLGVCVSVTE